MPIPIFEAIFGVKPATTSAQVAKERLQILIAHERSGQRNLDFMPKLKQEIIDVIKKYLTLDNEDDVKIHMGREGDYEVLEVNVTLPDDPPLQPIPKRRR